MLSRFNITFGLAALAALANAAHYDVTVGKGGQLKFDPETLTAQPGDTVTYKFFAKNHAVAQSTFANPCQLQPNGIFSGFTPNTSPDVAAPTTFTITVNDTKPLWFYCPQTNGNHCQNGMVHSINAPATGNTFDAYKTSAKASAGPSTPPVGTLPAGGLRKLHIDVGFDGNLVFNPNNVTELVGTVLEFEYNPMNHSIVQSSFDKPCQPLDAGFAAPFFPTKQVSSGVTFEVLVKDDKPIWFYCAQTAKTHCQAGMVGSVNAPASGDKTFDAFLSLASKAPPSTIPPHTPIVGTLKVNGTIIPDVGGTVLNVTALDPSLIGNIPPVGTDYSPYIGGMAGGNQPADYGWAPSITDEATEILQALQFISNALVAFLFEGYIRLSVGQWTGVYPTSITRSMGSLTAQSLINRKTYTDSLQHYGKPTIGLCQYDMHANTVDDWLDGVQKILALSISAKVDTMSLSAPTDSWLVPALATQLGSEARMSAVINMMQGHFAATSPREALMPYQLAYSYITNKYVVPGSCGEGDAAKSFGKVFPALTIKETAVEPQSGRLLSIKVEIPGGSTGDHWIAWIGPWGGIEYTAVAADGTAPAPSTLWGYVWIVLTTAKDLKARDIETAAVAGPEMVWTMQQWSS
ncbi:hypothetical protein GGS26DRAFT_594229 [Hypomontagnella submonticulosa]|nr:hypothetical protein GGS26DRAFT_594229 [Hypomontagnella submonticulosa]